MNKIKVVDLVQIAIVAALYVVVTVVLGPFGSGAIQFRLSELFNFLAFYNKKYIWSVTIGCVISNYISSGIVDVVVGSLSTLIFVTLGVYLFEKYMSQDVLGGLTTRAFIYFSLFFSFTMFTIAAELSVLFGLPFFLTWLTTGVGELISLLIGSVIIYQLSKRIDLTK
ncbi:QueT transporter family protein [Pseudolactococcus plantarum]|uniref:Queuosine transporter QueT n=1 Tax=Pseudolactococcus plantarum TaxID=1365 RepID=A0A2A5RXE2_9LACT|nr:QueT transporter family protein [Lactococcus plantarum]PCS05902.1 queuosine transporter QueT [Lactococcus plantarum]HCN74179.1 queuosine transporter QueT [Lactococcus sp.]